MQLSIDQLFRECIPSDTKDLSEVNRCIHNFYKLKRVVVREDLTDLPYIVYNAIDYFSSVEGVLTKPVFYNYLASKIDRIMVDKKVNVKEIIDDFELDTNIQGQFEIAKEELMKALSAYYEDIVEIEPNPGEYNSYLKLYAEKIYKDRYQEILKEASIILVKGLDVFENGKWVHLYGQEDSHTYFVTQVNKYRNRIEFSENKEFTTTGDVSQLDEIEKDLEHLMEVVSDTGIEPIDKKTKGFRRTQLITVDAESGVGKSRFSRWIAYRAITKNKKNVLDFTLEQERAEIWFMYVSMHLYNKYKIFLPDSEILKKSYPQKMRDLIRMAAHDLFTNPEYGKLWIKATDVYVDDMFEELRGFHKSEYPFDVLVYDYASLTQKREYNNYASDMHEITSRVFRGIKRDICRGLGVMAIVVNQLNKRGSEKANKGEMTGTYDSSNSGEVFKSSDEIYVLSSDESLDRDNKVRISNPKTRQGEKMYHVYADQKKGVSWFGYSHVEEATEEEIREALESIA